MISETFELRTEKTEHGFMPTLKTYILDKNEWGLRPMIIVCPGGGYCNVCEGWEGERTAMCYSAAGFCAATLNYSVAPHRYPEGLLDIAAAIKLCRENAEKWQIDPNKIIVLGYSAAGHLAANISVEWNNEKLFSKHEIESRTYRPDYSVLCYPVITAGEQCHAGSLKNLTGSENPADWQNHSLEKMVNKDTPPAFIWHTFEDTCVPVANSLLYAEALRNNGVPFELHTYEKGDHGLQIGTQHKYRNKASRDRKYDWVKESIEWLEEHFED
jgi:acetyl esterase/lipase